MYFLESGEGREKERERSINVQDILIRCLSHAPNRGQTQAPAVTGNQIGNLLVHRPALNPLSHTSQGFMIFLILYCYTVRTWEGTDKCTFSLLTQV